MAAAPASHQLKQAVSEEKPLGKPVAATPAAPIAAPAAVPHEAPAKPVVPPDAVSLKPMVKAPPATAKPTASAAAASAPQVSAVKGVSPGAALNGGSPAEKYPATSGSGLAAGATKSPGAGTKDSHHAAGQGCESQCCGIAAQNKPVASQAVAESAASHAAHRPRKQAQPPSRIAHAEASKAVTPKPVVSKAPEAEKPASFLVDDVLAVLHDNAVPLAGGAAVIGLSGLLLAQRRRRNKQEAEQPPAEPLPAADNPSMLTMGPLTTLDEWHQAGEISTWLRST
jgi:hypothetical protein